MRIVVSAPDTTAPSSTLTLPSRPPREVTHARPLIGSSSIAEPTQHAHDPLFPYRAPPRMPSQTEIDALRRDVDRLNQPLRLVLVGFVALGTLHEELSGSRQLKDFPKRAIPMFLKSLRDTLPAEKWCAPTLSATGKMARDELVDQFQPTLGEGAGPLATIAVGTRPLALVLEECLTADNYLGIYRQGEGARPGSLGLQASRILTEVVGPYLREMEGCSMRIFLDRSIRGQGKGQAKGKGRGKGKAGKGKQKGGRGGPPRQPQNLPPPPDVAPPVPPAGPPVPAAPEGGAADMRDFPDHVSVSRFFVILLTAVCFPYPTVPFDPESTRAHDF